MSIQGWEWIVILIVVLLVFGIGRIGKLGEELGKGVRSFREGVKDATSDESADKKDEIE
jgi:sec-independent protein translocase protein TatA